MNHWDFPDFAMWCAHFQVVGSPLAFRGDLEDPARFVDFRIYLARLLEDYLERAGRMVLGPAPVSEALAHASAYDLVVVAGGRESSDLFPRDPARSPYARPQRVLCAGTFQGIAFPDPLGLSFNISPGGGEVFQSPIFSFDGKVSGILFEGLPGGPFEPLVRMRYEDDPVAFEDQVLELLRVHAPAIHERVDRSEFGLTRPVDLLQGAITPTVRHAWMRLDSGTYAVAIGDAWVVNDPIAGQGANLGSHCAWVAADAILNDGLYDELFCRQLEERMWQMAGPVTAWSNAFLQPPPPMSSSCSGRRPPTRPWPTRSCGASPIRRPCGAGWPAPNGPAPSWPRQRTANRRCANGMSEGSGLVNTALLEEEHHQG